MNARDRDHGPQVLARPLRDLQSRPWPMIAALYVDPVGIYGGRADVDCWGVDRDARLYGGPWPVVAHPPCERWGRYWHGGPNSVRFPRQRRLKGDDAGCFAAALAAVRRWGGVLEHPQASAAWAASGLISPPFAGGWISAGDFLGWTCCVEQGHYGHRARKATWLYAAGVRALPSLRWGRSAARVRFDSGFHTAAERRMFTRPPAGISPDQRARRRAWLYEHESRTGKVWCGPERMGRRERAATPGPFAELLLGIALHAGPDAAHLAAGHDRDVSNVDES